MSHMTHSPQETTTPNKGDHVYDFNLDDEQITEREIAMEVYEFDMEVVDEAHAIEAFQHAEPESEAPTNGLDEIVDWDDLERDLVSGKINSKSAFATSVKAMYDEAEVPLPMERANRPNRANLRLIIEGLFLECRDIYKSLPNSCKAVAA